MAVKVAIFAALSASSTAARVRGSDESEKAKGSVANLYTWGCPKVAIKTFTNPARIDGCFPGFRCVNIEDEIIDDVDIVPSLGVLLTHTKTPSLYLAQEGKDTQLLKCGKKEFHIRSPRASLHMGPVYQERASAYGDAGLTAATQVGLATSYLSDVGEIKMIANAAGWKLIGTAADGEDVSHLFQKADGSCMVTFEGSDTWSDWVTDVAALPVKSFCGLDQKVHRGFKAELLRMTGADSWQNIIKPKFEGCSSVASTGHSLGGALATLFAGCVNSGNSGNEDYDLMAFNRGSPHLYPEI